MIVDNGDGSNFHLRASLRDCGKNGGAFGAVGHAVGGILHIAAGDELSSAGQERRAHSEMRVRRVGVLHRFTSSIDEPVAQRVVGLRFGHDLFASENLSSVVTFRIHVEPKLSGR